jgi:hypothetical protein
MDLFIKADPANAQATYAALAAFGAPLLGIRAEDFAERGSFFRFGHDPHSFDILPDIPGVDFEAAWARRVEGVIDPKGGLKAFFISASDLIASKLASGRLQDLADAEAVRKAAEAQPRQPAKEPPA